MNTLGYLRYRNPVSVLLLCGLLTACNPDRSGINNPNDPNGSPSGGLASLSFEAENLTYRELADPKSANAFAKINAMARATRSQISVEIYEDGTSAWKMVKQDPKIDTKPRDLTPPDRTPQTRTTRIDRSGMGYFYGDDGTLLHSDAVPTPSFADLAKRVRQDPSAVFTLMGVKDKAAIDKLLADARQNGAIVEDLGNGNVSVQKTVTVGGGSSASSVAKGARTTGINYKSVDVVNTSLNIVTGSRLYDDKERLVSESFFRYKDSGGGKLVPDAIFQKTWTISEKTGETIVMVSNTYFDKITTKTNG
jgi:hypothetical protein